MPTFRINHPADFYVKKKENRILKKFLAINKIQYTPLVSNVTDAILKQRPTRPKKKNEKYDYEQYHPLEEVRYYASQTIHKGL